MKPWQQISVPTKLASRPRDARGYPIPYSVVVGDDGKPDFRITDTEKWSRAFRLRLCALCGEAMGRHLAFVGGPLTFTNRLFTDLPMHRDCATYALHVCPFLAAPNFSYAESLAVPDGFRVQASALVASTRPDRFFLGTTRGSKLVQTPDGSLLVLADPWESHRWWSNGAPDEAAPD